MLPHFYKGVACAFVAGVATGIAGLATSMLIIDEWGDYIFAGIGVVVVFPPLCCLLGLIPIEAYDPEKVRSLSFTDLMHRYLPVATFPFMVALVLAEIYWGHGFLRAVIVNAQFVAYSSIYTFLKIIKS